MHRSQSIEDRREIDDESAHTLPDEFVVRFTPSGDIAMVCKIVWSRDGAVGLRFTARASTPKLATT